MLYDIVCTFIYCIGLIQVFDGCLNHKIASLSIQSEGGGILTSHFEYMIRAILFLHNIHVNLPFLEMAFR